MLYETVIEIYGAKNEAIGEDGVDPKNDYRKYEIYCEAGILKLSEFSDEDFWKLKEETKIMMNDLDPELDRIKTDLQGYNVTIITRIKLEQSKRILLSSNFNEEIIELDYTVSDEISLLKLRAVTPHGRSKDLLYRLRQNDEVKHFIQLSDSIFNRISLPK